MIKMRGLLICLCLAVVAMAQQLVNPKLLPLTRLTEDEIRQIMNNPARVNFNVRCILQRNPCPEDPIAEPLLISIQDWSASKKICGNCNGNDRRKVSLMISLLQQNYIEQYNAVARAFGLI